MTPHAHLTRKGRSKHSTDTEPLTSLDFSSIEEVAQGWADHIEKHFDALSDILLTYESFEVVQDEIGRTLDHLRSLKENKEYFKLRIGAVTTFLPRNQPLYALTCFVVVPSLMASEVHFRIPNSMRHFFAQMLDLLEVKEFFPNVTISSKERMEFLKERSSFLVDPKTLDTKPITDAVIFTGTPTHADQLRLIFDKRTLFIANGAGHNPLVVTDTADLAAAVEATLTLQLYNQGQDCAAPNAILVHTKVLQDFLRILHDQLRLVRIGHYSDRSARVGPISDPKDLVRIQEFLIEHQAWLDPAAPGIIRSRDAILEPTIIIKPLKEGGNFNEIFAPVIFVQEYEKDAALAQYFEDPQYARNAMYATVYGKSPYVNGLTRLQMDGKQLHDRGSIFHDTHLHMPGVERGTKPYGGNGYGASSLSINGKIIAKATLPQRDIYEWVAKPLLRPGVKEKHLFDPKRFTTKKEKDVEKLLRLKLNGAGESKTPSSQGQMYVDLQASTKGKRYVVFDEDSSFSLLEAPNAEYIAGLGLQDLRIIRSIRTALMKKKRLSLEAFTTWLYARAHNPQLSEKENRARQMHLFQHLYNLLLGKKSGPRLAPFLMDIDQKKALELLDV